MKTVEYMGSTYEEIPEWANFIAADGDGHVYVYEYMPSWSHNHWVNSGAMRSILVGEGCTLGQPLKTI